MDSFGVFIAQGKMMETAFCGHGRRKQIEYQTRPGPNYYVVFLMLFIQIKIKLSKQRKESFITNKSMALSFPNTHQHDLPASMLPRSLIKPTLSVPNAVAGWSSALAATYSRTRLSLTLSVLVSGLHRQLIIQTSFYLLVKKWGTF